MSAAPIGIIGYAVEYYEAARTVDLANAREPGYKVIDSIPAPQRARTSWTGTHLKRRA
jgi:hypothetical protein